MIFLFHGDDIRASRVAFLQLFSDRPDEEIRRVEGKNINETVLVQALESQSMFGKKPVVVIESLLSVSAKKSEWLKKICVTLRSEHGSQVILWEPRQISAAIIKYLGSEATVREFSLPVVLFQFLDTLKPGNGKQLGHLFRTITERDSPELLHALLVKRIRQLIMVRNRITPVGLADWQVRRLTSQVQFFTMEKLTDVQEKLLDMEYRVKTGSTPFSLSQHMEQMIAFL